MSVENALVGRAARIHGELLKLGFAVAQSTVAKYMVKRRGPPSQTWRTFLRNHAPDIAAIDLFVVPTLSFGLLYGVVIIRITPAQPRLGQRYGQPDGRLDREAVNRSIPVAGGPTVLDP